jgi:hypothetical protein
MWKGLLNPMANNELEVAVQVIPLGGYIYLCKGHFLLQV